MPELPEVEVLVRHLAPRLVGRTIQHVRVLDRRSLRQCSPARFTQALKDTRFQCLERRGKYLVCTLQKRRHTSSLLIHLGMTGRLYLTGSHAIQDRHATVVLETGRQRLVFGDARRFGGMTLDPSVLNRLGPEPLTRSFTVDALSRALAGSRQPIKARLLDQSVVAGLGNIYTSEALFLARIDPRTPSRRLDEPALRRLQTAIRRVLSHAIRLGSSLPLDFSGPSSANSLFYFGQAPGHGEDCSERFRVYDREGKRCRRCNTSVKRTVQAGRSTFFCPQCQV